MGCLVIDLNPDPPIAADDRGETWELGPAPKVRVDRVADSDLAAQPAHPPRPADYLIYLGDYKTGDVLVRFFKQALEGLGAEADDWLAVLGPSGLAPEAAARIREAAARHWRGRILVADGAPVLAAGMAPEPIDQPLSYLIFRRRLGGVEASIIRVHKKNGALHCLLEKQCYAASAEEADTRLGSDNFHKARRVRALRSDELIQRTARFLERVRQGQAALEVERRSVIGIEADGTDFIPLLCEDAPPLERVTRTLASADRGMAELNVLHGYPGMPLLRLESSRLVPDRITPGPREVRIAAERALDGRVNIEAAWPDNQALLQVSFPYLLT